jgi:hypothetical protein
VSARVAFLQAPPDVISDAEIIVCRPPDALGFIADAARGDRHAARVLVSVNDLLNRLDAAPHRPSLVCAGCQQPIRPGVACSFVMWLPEDESVPCGLVAAVCRRCATSRAQVRRKALAALKVEMPGLRVVEATHGNGGRA